MSTGMVLSERIVLGTMLRGDDPGFTTDTLGLLTPAAFTVPAHRTVFTAIARTADTGAVDLSTVMVTLDAADSLTAVGGFNELSAAVQESFTSTAPTDHVARIADRAAVEARRRALQQAAVALDDGQDLDTNRAFLMDALASTSTTAQLLPSISDQVYEYFALLDQRLHGEVPAGLRTGWSRFDEITLGLQPGSLVTVAGRAGTGKTVVMMDWARQACRDDNGVLFIPLEMSAQQMIERAISAEACVELNKLREPGCLDDDQWDRISGAISAISQWPLYIDTHASSVSDIRRTATAAKAALAESGRELRLIVVDYLQLMKADSGGRGAITRAEEIGRFTRGLKLLARELELVVVVGSQFNRSAADPNKLPRLDELKESGSIEEDSDIVLALHRPHAIDGQIGMATADEITGLILKNRHGAAQAQFERSWHGHLASTDEPMRRN
ncbi:replicative DNA helicase [Rhodococcus artemisiae]|uniref:DNA 5'-3' helicase n=1 Tax=Rhodococcus artemisiae TaxID=714159 RepID=A0ABU7LIZ4_9NOCA|nr:DnaB-like helicase C-terminal domain-containing protein [Rhodococcus artemisiae]MEE2061519.1 DnaB-like helicase C-terminal domain-containing protein [Rhodococcus artemisiae]